MSFFGKIFGSKKNVALDQTTQHQLSRQRDLETANNPVLFAKFIIENLISSISFEEDLELAPNQETYERLQISEKERILCANEQVLLRTLGACMFVRSHLDEYYYLEFKKNLMPVVAERMSRHAPYQHPDDPPRAIEEYQEALKSDNHVAFSMVYMDRVYPDCPNSAGIFAAGIPISLGLSSATKTAEIVRNGYCLLKTGYPYEVFEAMSKLDEEEK